MRTSLTALPSRLIELLVVIAIIAVLIGLLLPAVQRIRESAARTKCQNNLKQIALALQSYQSTVGTFPCVAELPKGTTSQPWSAQARLLPYLEQENLHRLIDFNTVANDFSTRPDVAKTRVAVYLCPSEVRDEERTTLQGFTYYPLNYCFNEGTWFIYDPESDQFGNGAFAPNFHAKPSDFTDGLSNTLATSEVKTFQPSVWDTGTPNSVGVAAPDNVAGLNSYFGGQFDQFGHTEWVEGDVHETGFTTTFPPNTKVPYTKNGVEYDIDFTSMRDGESITLPTYAAVTARSYHTGMVNAALMDGSVRTFHDSTDQNLWRAYGTRAGGEVFSDE